jgi:S1-C subfamily serine protease
MKLSETFNKPSRATLITACILGLACIGFSAPGIQEAYVEHLLEANVGKVELADSLHQPIGSGTGWLLSGGNGIVITNYHVCGGAPFITFEGFSAQVIQAAPESDLCALRVDVLIGASGGLSESPNDSDDILKQDVALFVGGYPLGGTYYYVRGKSKNTVEGFTVIGPRYALPPNTPCINPNPSMNPLQGIYFAMMCVVNMVQTRSDVQIYGGNSGSPVLNWKGQVVGVIRAEMNNEGFFIPLKALRPFLSNLP